MKIMRKIFFFILFFIIPAALQAQLSGSGTYADPWSGTLAGDATWSGTKYINGDITVDNETLTISPGAIIIFLAENADLLITGTGRLLADGTSGNPITFTADDDNDGNYGETGERWGHISFDAMTTTNTSSLTYCIIEYGEKTGSGVEGYGGGLHINFNYVSVGYCTFRYNKAQWGGALFVNKTQSPAIYNCNVTGNISLHGGGGFYFWNNAGSTITNCIFDSNQCQEPTVSYYTGGGLAAQTGTSVKIINCTFVNNSSTRPEGQALLLHSSPDARVINSIFWGAPEKQIYLYGTTAGVMINSAYRGITYTSGTPVNPVVLNSSNSASDGPNFTATDGSNWSIKFVSPCRDAGVNSYTGVTIPSLDFTGNSRIYTTDIGAYEVMYSRWKTTPSDIYTWSAAGNWEQGIYPTHTSATGDVIIPALSSSSEAPDVSSVSIPSGNYMILEPGAKASISSLTNNGTLIIGSNSSVRSSLITDSYSGNDAQIEMFLSGGGTELDDNFKWHYISSPVTSLSASVFTGTTPDLAQFVESRPVMSLMQGWVAYDGYVYSTGLSNGPTFSTLTTGSNGKGYNYFDYYDHSFTFSGALNTSDVTANLGFAGNPSLHGFNLLGNPFMAGLDWDIIVSDAGYPDNTSKGVYFTRDNVQCTYIGGVGIPGDVTGIIPPMQGFFTKTYATGNSIVLSASARTHDNIHSYYKGSGVIPLVRITLEEIDLNDETVVRFDNTAKPGLDNDFDMVKMVMSDTKTQIYSASGEVNYAINGQPFPGDTLIIPLVVNLATSGEHTIRASQLQGLDGYGVKLKDAQTGTITNLKKNPAFVFNSGPGKISGRFTLEIISGDTRVEKPAAESESFRIYVSGNIINIIPLSPEWEGRNGSVNIIDLSGRTVRKINGVDFRYGSPVQVPAPGQKGILFVDVRSGMKRHTAKVAIK